MTEADAQRMLRAENPGFEEYTEEGYFPTLDDGGLTRLGCKQATGSGKTVVMAMLIAWSLCNRGVNPASRGFPSGVLVCCPNLTVRERLAVLDPAAPDNYYDAFDLVPLTLRDHLNRGVVEVTNWHRFAEESEHRGRRQELRRGGQGARDTGELPPNPLPAAGGPWAAPGAQRRGPPRVAQA